MRTTYKNNGRGGHCPNHVRDTFLTAIDAYLNWDDGKAEPTVAFEARYEPRQIPISKAFRQVWNCNDILPSATVSSLEWAGIEFGRRTYAAAARSLTRAIGMRASNLPAL